MVEDALGLLEKFAKVSKKTDDGDGMDPVGKGDADIDNDGDVDSSDKYLKMRRKAIGKAIAKKEAKSYGVVSRSMTPMRDRFGKSDSEKEAEAKKKKEAEAKK